MASNDNGKVCAALSYILIGIIWYAVDKEMQKDAFVKFHVKQGLVVFLFSIAVSIVNVILGWIPFIGWLIVIVLNIAVLVLVILGILKAVNNKKEELPVVGSFAKLFTF